MTLLSDGNRPLHPDSEWYMAEFVRCIQNPLVLGLASFYIRKILEEFPIDLFSRDVEKLQRYTGLFFYFGSIDPKEWDSRQGSSGLSYEVTVKLMEALDQVALAQIRYIKKMEGARDS